MLYIKFKKYVRRVCIHKNNTLNSQITYWKGQKRSVVYFNENKAPTGELYPFFRAFTLNKFRPFSGKSVWVFKTRNGRGMKWTNRPRRRIGWGICKRLNAPPHKLNNITKKYSSTFLNKIRVLQRKFKFKPLLQTFAELSQIPTMSTLSQQGVVKRSNTHVYSTD